MKKHFHYFHLVGVVNGGWGAWSDWSACSVSCGPGTSIRTRKCDNPAPGPGGSSCVGLPVASKPCDFGPCAASKYLEIYLTGAGQRQVSNTFLFPSLHNRR